MQKMIKRVCSAYTLSSFCVKQFNLAKTNLCDGSKPYSVAKKIGSIKYPRTSDAEEMASFYGFRC
jgi:hypothetical protein